MHKFQVKWLKVDSVLIYISIWGTWTWTRTSKDSIDVCLPLALISWWITMSTPCVKRCESMHVFRKSLCICYRKISLCYRNNSLWYVLSTIYDLVHFYKELFSSTSLHFLNLACWNEHKSDITRALVHLKSLTTVEAYYWLFVRRIHWRFVDIRYEEQWCGEVSMSWQIIAVVRHKHLICNRRVCLNWSWLRLGAYMANIYIE